MENSPWSVGAIGCDDGRIRKLSPEEWALYVCASMVRRNGLLYPSRAVIGRIRVDGLDATSILGYAIRSVASDLDRAEAVFLDSLTIAGFNIVSPYALRILTGIPVIVTYTYKPSYARLARAASRLPTYRLIEGLLRLAGEAIPLETPHGVVYVVTSGLGEEEALSILKSYQVHTRKPEPVRLAHQLASELSLIIKPGQPRQALR